MTLLLTLDDGSLHRKLAEAGDVARAAVLADAPADQVGEHVGVEREDAVSASHLFEAAVPGYRGWRWSVTVAVAGPDEPVTVSELCLRPGPAALVAPAWVPWDRRVRAGDLGVGDLFPTGKDDPRIVPGYLASDDPAVEEAALEAGLGRVHVLSRPGRLDAAARWHDGEFGPRSDMARSAPATCGTCGFFVPLAGSLRAAFGACANDIAPADGHVVDVQYGCGAHSEIEVEVTSSVPVAELVYDDSLIDFSPAPEPSVESGAGSAGESVAERGPEGAAGGAAAAFGADVAGAEASAVAAATAGPTEASAAAVDAATADAAEVVAGTESGVAPVPADAAGAEGTEVAAGASDASAGSAGAEGSAVTGVTPVAGEAEAAAPAGASGAAASAAVAVPAAGEVPGVAAGVPVSDIEEPAIGEQSTTGEAPVAEAPVRDAEVPVAGETSGAGAESGDAEEAAVAETPRGAEEAVVAVEPGGAAVAETSRGAGEALAADAPQSAGETSVAEGSDVAGDISAAESSGAAEASAAKSGDAGEAPAESAGTEAGQGVGAPEGGVRGSQGGESAFGQGVDASAGAESGASAGTPDSDDVATGSEGASAGSGVSEVERAPGASGDDAAR
ncbi:DUF3027 domain-containing protein [Amycolatopsis panacis]|uniref:DUF3027 domain-containing protein n=1 Tax=Amycolatopsis panacis TaxID=2340917 RepID=UPI001F2683D5|nr:DUF3027 domain-containing protein [Amycolatopsis panacis]